MFVINLALQWAMISGDARTGGKNMVSIINSYGEAGALQRDKHEQDKLAF